MLVPAASEHGDAVGAVELDRALGLGRPPRDLEHLPPAFAAQDAAQVDGSFALPVGDRRLGATELTEDLAPDREIVGREHPDRVDIVVRTAPPDAHGLHA